MHPTKTPQFPSSLLAQLAHDMRNPLASLAANLAVAKSALRSSPEDARDAIADATFCCDWLELLIGNLDVLGGAGASARREEAVLGDIVEAAVRRAGPNAESSGVRLARVEPDERPVVRVVPMLFGRALDNVLANAVQYSSKGGAVEIAVGVEPPYARLRVMDDGPVVAPERREAALTAETQATAKQAIEYRYGRGLGLYCAAEAARLAGAALVVTERGGRSCLCFDVPLAERFSRGPK